MNIPELTMQIEHCKKLHT